MTSTRRRRRRQIGILSPRQLEVARLLQRGLSYVEVAQQIWTEPSTVKVHAHRIYRALGISSREQLANFRLMHWADPRTCANDDCAAEYIPEREGQRFCTNACARAEDARLRREQGLAERSEVDVWIDAAVARVRDLNAMRSARVPR